MDGITTITLQRYIMDLELKPETRKNVSLLECAHYLLDNEPDGEA